MKTLFARETSLLAQLFFTTLFSLILILCDIHYRPFSSIRYYLDSIISPIYQITNTPRMTLEFLDSISKQKQTLINENFELKDILKRKESDLLRLDYLKRENDRLHELLGSPLRDDEYKKEAEVLLSDSDPYTSQIVLDKGEKDNVFVGQPVIDEKGVIGQIYKTAYNTSRAILICDTQHAIPVQVARNGDSMVALGNGCNNDLILDYLPNNVDVKVGDELITTGLDGRFPEGYPVAKVSSVKLDTASGSTPVISATPYADLKRLRYLLLLWNKSKIDSSQNKGVNE